MTATLRIAVPVFLIIGYLKMGVYTLEDQNQFIFVN